MKRNCCIFIFLIFGLVSCQQASVSSEIPEIIKSYPHDTNAFTQGLLFYNDRLYESTGLRGESDLREVILESGQVNRILELEAKYFAEGLARVGDKLYQITWQAGDAFVYDLATFGIEDRFRYEGEGWGLCYDGSSLFMTDGSDKLYQRNPDTFEITKTLMVSLNEQAVSNLNELECVGDHIYANIWLTDMIVKIDKKTGRVVTEIDASKLLSDEEEAVLDPNAVLNGIAYNKESQTFYLTGKLWPKLFEVRFIDKN